ncbi:MAG: hypothetical protein H6Q61_342 [Firmicutes bacterium]|nr:hypothetical protein [Bacillota bacterium]
MNPCGGTIGVTALANLIAETMSDEELELFLLSVVQFKVTIENILLTRAVIKRKGEVLEAEPTSAPGVTSRATPNTGRR